MASHVASELVTWSHFFGVCVCVADEDAEIKRGRITMEKKMETTIVHWSYIGVMKKKMETTI